MARMARIPRCRGAVSGVLLILLGAWGALVPFVGPYFHYAYTPDTAWSYTSGRLWLEILPGAAAVLGGALVAVSARRLLAGGGAILAALGGAWFTVGSILGPTWSGTWMNPGTPVGGTSRRALEQIGFFTGLGVVIVFIAAMALGRYLVAAKAAGRHREDVADDGTDSTATGGDFLPGDDATAGRNSTAAP
jgi:hypothetical protein